MAWALSILAALAGLFCGVVVIAMPWELLRLKPPLPPDKSGDYR